MKAILINEDKSLSWTSVEDPILKPGNVIVEIHAAALNRADLLQRNGNYPSPEGWPSWMGLELAGVIIEMSEEAKANSEFKVGDEVCALVGGGAYAEAISVPYELILPIPKGLSMIEAATIPEAFMTTYLNVFEEGHLQKGQTVYISAGGSGLATMTIPMLKVFGAKVITSVRSRYKADLIKDLGADYIIVEEEENVPDVFKRLALEGNPVNVCMDCVGGPNLGKAMKYMAKGGYWIVISSLAGNVTEIDLKSLLSNGLHLVGSLLRIRSNEYKHQIMTKLRNEFWKYFEDGTFKPLIYKVFDIKDAEAAQEILIKNQNIGKVVLKVK